MAFFTPITVILVLAGLVFTILTFQQMVSVDGALVPLLTDDEVSKQTPAGTTQSTLTADQQNNTSNESLEGFNVTHYIYVDYPRWGYELFKRKVIDAFRMLDLFFTMEPIIIKITNIYIFPEDKVNNDSDSNVNKTTEYGVDNTTSGTEPAPPESSDQEVETNTESPLKSEPTELPVIKPQEENITTLDTLMQDNSTSPTQASDVDDVGGKIQKTEDEQVTKQKIESKGFLKSATNAIENVFHSVTSWFG